MSANLGSYRWKRQQHFLPEELKEFEMTFCHHQIRLDASIFFFFTIDEQGLIATRRVDLSSKLNVSEQKGKLAEPALPTQDTEYILREQLTSFLDAEENKEDYFSIENPSNETEMANLISYPAELTVPVERFASGTGGILKSKFEIDQG